MESAPCSAFALDCNAICTFVHHLCEAALHVLPRVVGENRFRIVRTSRTRGSAPSEVVLEPLQNMPKCYMSTHSRFDPVNALTASEQREACRAEIMTMQRGVNKVCQCVAGGCLTGPASSKAVSGTV